RLASELGERLLQRRARQGVDVPQRAEHEQSAVGELTCEVLKEEERRRIGGMEVVEREEDRTGTRGVAEELRGRVEQAEPRALGIERRRLGQIGEALAQLGDDLGDVSRARTELYTKLLRLARAHVRTQRLHPRPVRGRASGLPATADEHVETTRTRHSDQLLS